MHKANTWPQRAAFSSTCTHVKTPTQVGTNLYTLLAGAFCLEQREQMTSTAYPQWPGRPQLSRGECNDRP
eukprot:scaffold12640_cov20-Tisochrysis_lutea.AAC.1